MGHEKMEGDFGDFGEFEPIIEMMRDANITPAEFIKIIKSGITDLSQIKRQDKILKSLNRQTRSLLKAQVLDKENAQKAALVTEETIRETEKIEEQIARLTPLYQELAERHRKLLEDPQNNFLIQREQQHQRDWEQRIKDQDTDTLRIQAEIALLKSQNEEMNLQLERVNMEIERLIDK